MFSGVVKVQDLNDYILPSQDCVVQLAEVGASRSSHESADKGPSPVRPDLIQLQPKRKHKKNNALIDSEHLASTLPSPSDDAHQRVADNDRLPAAQVSLYDCLACSGCVTASETVLLQEQSIDAFLSQVHNYPFPVVSFSLESLRFLASYFQCTTTKQCFRKLTSFFKLKLNVGAVIDVSLFQSVALVESARHFLNSYAATDTTTQCSNAPQPFSGATSLTHRFPLFTSHCPGWICFCEKHQNTNLVSHICPLKSAQQIGGFFVKTLMVDCYNLDSFLKHHRVQTSCFPLGLSPSLYTTLLRSYPHLCRKTSLGAGDVFHTTIVPCYDKKLEMFRKDARLPEYIDKHEVKEVDLALSTGEVIELLTRYGITTPLEFSSLLCEYPAELLDDVLLGTALWYPWHLCYHGMPHEIRGGDSLLSIFSHEASLFHSIRSLSTHGSEYCLCCHTLVPTAYNNDSGGFLEYVYRLTTEKLFNIRIPDASPLKYDVLANKDYQQVKLHVDGHVALTFLRAYGFRNVQNIAISLDKTLKCKPVHFVEVMACPKGCNYGAGQVASPRPGGSTLQAFTDFLNDQREPVVLLSPHHNPLVYLLYQYTMYRAPQNWEYDVDPTARLEVFKAAFQSVHHQETLLHTRSLNNW